MIRSLCFSVALALAISFQVEVVRADQPQAGVSARPAVLTKSVGASSKTPVELTGFHHRRKAAYYGGYNAGGYGYGASYPYYSSYNSAYSYSGGLGSYGLGGYGGMGYGGYYGSYGFPYYNAYSYYWPRSSVAYYSPWASFYGMTNYGYGPYMYRPTCFGLGYDATYGSGAGAPTSGGGGYGGCYYW